MSTRGRPTNAVNDVWDTSTVTLIDDDVTYPAAGDGYVVIADNKDDDSEQIYGSFTWDADLSDTYSSITSIKWRCRCKDDGGFDETIDMRLKINGTWTSAQQITYNGTMTGYEKEFTGSWDPADVEAIEVGNLIGSNPELNVDYLQLEVDGVLAGDSVEANGASAAVAMFFE